MPAAQMTGFTFSGSTFQFLSLQGHLAGLPAGMGRMGTRSSLKVGNARSLKGHELRGQGALAKALHLCFQQMLEAACRRAAFANAKSRTHGFVVDVDRACEVR